MFSEEKAIKQLYEIYNVAFEKITKRIISSKLSGKSSLSDSRILKDINNQLKELRSNNINFANSIIPKVYERTQAEIIDFFEKNNIIKEGSKNFAKIHKGAINELVKELVGNLDDGLIQIGRKSKDLLNEITNKASAMRLAGATTQQEMINELVTLLTKKGIDKIVYGNNATISIKDYVKMSTSSSISGSINRATVNQTLEYGNNYVQLSWHSTSCPVCSPYQGRVYQLKGDDEYPNISVINDGAIVNYGIIHQ